jgi:hypothetical protein
MEDTLAVLYEIQSFSAPECTVAHRVTSQVGPHHTSLLRSEQTVCFRAQSSRVRALTDTQTKQGRKRATGRNIHCCGSLLSAASGATAQRKFLGSGELRFPENKLNVPDLCWLAKRDLNHLLAGLLLASRFDRDTRRSLRDVVSSELTAIPAIASTPNTHCSKK